MQLSRSYQTTTVQQVVQQQRNHSPINFGQPNGPYIQQAQQTGQVVIQNRGVSAPPVAGQSFYHQQQAPQISFQVPLGQPQAQPNVNQSFGQQQGQLGQTGQFPQVQSQQVQPQIYYQQGSKPQSVPQHVGYQVFQGQPLQGQQQQVFQGAPQQVFQGQQPEYGQPITQTYIQGQSQPLEYASNGIIWEHKFVEIYDKFHMVVERFEDIVKYIFQIDDLFENVSDEDAWNDLRLRYNEMMEKCNEMRETIVEVLEENKPTVDSISPEIIQQIEAQHG